MTAQSVERTILDPRSKLAVFIAACFSVFSGLSVMQEITLFLLVCVTMLVCRKWRWVMTVVILFAAMVLCDMFMVERLAGPPQYAALLFSNMLRFLLPLFGSFYVVTRTSTVGEYISAFMAMRLPGVVIIPIAVMFRFVPTLTEEWRVVTQAMRLRGMALTVWNVLRRPLYMMENMLVPFLMQSAAIVDEMSAAIMARGFDKDHPRTSYLEVKMMWFDWCVILLSGGVLVWNLGW